MKIPRFSRSLLLTILVPLVSGVLMFSLVLFSFEASRGVAIEKHEREVGELAELAASSIEILWVAPRNKTIKALARSDTLERRLKGQATFDVLAWEWRIAEELLHGYFFIYYGLRDGTIEFYPDGELSEGYDPRERPWYKVGMSIAEGPGWTAPYEEDITGDMVVSTVAPIYLEGRKIGVFSADIQFEGLKTILERIQLPTGGSVFLVDESGSPFVGTDESYVGEDSLPPSNDEFFVASSAPMSNGWRASILVPRTALAESFADLLQSLMIASALILLIGGGLTSLLVARIAARAYGLANYFQEAQKGSTSLREIFRTEDEFAFLNRRFNQVMNEARSSSEREIAQERSFRFLVEQTPVGFFRSNGKGALLYINPYCVSMLGYASQDEAMREITSVRDLYDDGEARDRFLQELLAHGEVLNRKMCFVKRSGETFWVSMTAHIKEDSAACDVEDVEIEGFLIDVTGDVEERATLTKMAESDPLTGVANRRAFDTFAESVVRRAHATGERVALIFFDIDQFKPLNDTYGHDVGDFLLQEVARLGRRSLRENDLFARVGGDEFAVLLPGAGEEVAVRLAQRLREGVREMALPEPLTEPPTLSIGVAVQAGAEVRIPELVKVADTAMYEAKRSGRNQIVLRP